MLTQNKLFWFINTYFFIWYALKINNARNLKKKLFWAGTQTKTKVGKEKNPIYLTLFIVLCKQGRKKPALNLTSHCHMLSQFKMPRKEYKHCCLALKPSTYAIMQTIYGKPKGSIFYLCYKVFFSLDVFFVEKLFGCKYY